MRGAKGRAHERPAPDEGERQAEGKRGDGLYRLDVALKVASGASLAQEAVHGPHASESGGRILVHDARPFSSLVTLLAVSAICVSLFRASRFCSIMTDALASRIATFLGDRKGRAGFALAAAVMLAPACGAPDGPPAPPTPGHATDAEPEHAATGAETGAPESAAPEDAASSDDGRATTQPSEAGADAGAATDASAVSPDTGATFPSGDSGSRPACPFASGLNVAWVNFANDVPNPDMTAFRTIFTNTRNAGGRVIRWWFHTNGTVTPGYDANGMVQKIPASHIAAVTAVLNAAHAAGVAIDLSLWSFDMLQANAGNAHVNNQALLTVDANRQSYIDNYLTPLVMALKGNPGLYAYEIFNEPEGMTPSGWATYRVAETFIQKTVNWFADAIHAADPSVLVTNGAQEFQYCSNVTGKTNYYSDSALAAVGGRPKGTLDFYEVHYYSVNGTSNSCFLHPASYWGLDKRLVMGEFFAQTTDGVAQADTYTYLYTNGYNGAWAWSYDADNRWPSMQVPLQNLYAAKAATVGACP